MLRKVVIAARNSRTGHLSRFSNSGFCGTLIQRPK
jgi:hypothetical protein